jgi:GT2 family glycosyltransferase
VVDDRGTERDALRHVANAADAADHNVVIYQRPENGGFVRACNDAFAIAATQDVVLVNSDVVVGPEWIDRLVDAANSSNTVATVSTFTNNGTILSLPNRNRPDGRLPAGMTPELAAKAVAAASLQLRPTIPTGVGHCLYIRRVALNSVGDFDLAFARGYGEEVDFSQRAIRLGFKHIVADDVFTYHRGGASFGDEAHRDQQQNEALIHARYPWYRDAVERAMGDRFSPLARALECSRRALVGRRVGVDATCLGHGWSGTHTVTFETMIELARRCGQRGLIAFVTPALPSSLARDLQSHGIDLEVVSDLDNHEGSVVDVIYRPYQIAARQELRFLKRHASRVVVNQLDLIAWANPSYFANEHLWLEYRELQRLVLATVDGVAFLSQYAMTSARSEGLLSPGAVTNVVYCGSTPAPMASGAPRPPVGVDHVDRRPLLMAIGTAYHHKNRVFALRVLAGLLRRGVDARLALVGATPPDGHSLDDEAAMMIADRDLQERVIVLAHVDEPEKRWLYSHAALVLYPTLVEGFGLVPFEAAAFGTPTLASRQGALDEVLPRHIPTISEFDVDRTIEQAAALLADESARRALCDELVRHGSQFTWGKTAELLDALFEEVLSAPPNRVAATLGEDNLPLAVDSTLGWRKAAARRARLERLVGRLQAFGRVRRVVAPEGSARQRTIRSGVNWARRRATLADARRR